MALIKCGECGKQISEQATACPECGAPNGYLEKRQKKAKSNRRWAWVIIIGVIVIASNALKNSFESTAAPREAVYNSSYDGSVYQAEAYLKASLKDPDSYQSISWGKVTKLESGGYQTWNEYRAKNSFGGYVVGKYMFLLSPTGEVIRMDKLGE